MTSIFLSYARSDDEPFVKRLYGDLTARGFEVWWDRVSMPNRGLTFSDEIRRAIQQSDRLLLVVGLGAVESEYVRDEWSCGLDLDKPVHPIVRLGDVTLLPERLALYDARLMQDDADYQQEFARLVDQLEADPPRLGALHAVPTLPLHLIERPDAVRKLREAVTSDLERKIAVTGVPSRVSAQGMGGIGKSVLAACVARDTKIRHMFPDGVFWVPLGQEPRLPELQRELALALGDPAEFSEASTGKRKLTELLKDRQALVVIDDLWDAKHAEAFDVLGPHCRMLVTTRDATLVTTFGGTHYEVQLLSPEEAKRLLAQWVCVAHDQLPTEAETIIAECGRLPLALSISGAMIRDGRSWADVVADLSEAELEFVSHDLPDYPHKDVWKAIKVGVDAMAKEWPEYRDRFAELAVFPTDETIPEAAVEVLWAHTGGMSDRRSRDLLRLLAAKSLIRLNVDIEGGPDAPSRMSLHDLIHDFASRLAGNRRQLTEKLVEAYRAKCPQGWHAGPNDGYFFEHLVDHLLELEDWCEVETVLTDLPFLEAKNEAGMTFALATDYSTALAALPQDRTSRKILRLLEEALRRDINFIVRHVEDYPQALFQCLWNTGWWYDCSQAAEHFIEPQGEWTVDIAPWKSQGDAKLYALLERWRDDRRQSTDPLVWVRSHRPPPVRLGTAQKAVLRGHEGRVDSVSYSPDGRRLASSSSTDGTIRVWDVENGSELVVVSLSIVHDVSFSPDSRRIVSGSFDETVRVWDAETGVELAVLRGHEGCVDSVSYSPDGRRIVSGSSDETIRVWNAKTGVELAVLRGHEGRVESVSYSPNGARIVSGGGYKDKTVWVWDAASGGKLAVLRGHEGSVSNVSCSPDGQRIISGSSDGTVRVWDAVSGAELAVLRGHEGRVESLSYSPDGARIVSGSEDGTVRAWDAKSRTELVDLRGHEGHLECLSYGPDGQRIITGSSDKTVRVWDAESGVELAVLRGHEGNVANVSCSPDGRRIVSGSRDKTVRVWGVESGVELAVLRGHEGGVSSVSYSPDGRRIVSGSSDETVRVWDAESGVELAVLRGHEGGVTSVSYSPDDRRIVSGSSDKTVRVWDAASGVELDVLRGHEGEVSSVSFSPDGQRIISYSSIHKVWVWDALTGECLEVSPGPGSLVGALLGHRFRAIGRRGETVVRPVGIGYPVAWFPVILWDIATHPNGHAWAGVSGSHLYIVSLDGAAEFAIPENIETL